MLAELVEARCSTPFDKLRAQQSALLHALRQAQGAAERAAPRPSAAQGAAERAAPRPSTSSGRSRARCSTPFDKLRAQQSALLHALRQAQGAAERAAPRPSTSSGRSRARCSTPFDKLRAQQSALLHALRQAQGAAERAWSKPLVMALANLRSGSRSATRRRTPHGRPRRRFTPSEHRVHEQLVAAAGVLGRASVDTTLDPGFHGRPPCRPYAGWSATAAAARTRRWIRTGPPRDT